MNKNFQELMSTYEQELPGADVHLRRKNYLELMSTYEQELPGTDVDI